MRLVWQLGAVGVAAIVGGQVVSLFEENPWVGLPLGVLTAVFLIHLYRWVVRRTERREVTELAWEGAGAKTGAGAVLGVALFVLVIVSIAVPGYYSVDGIGSPGGAIALIGVMATAAVTEELIFRGILFRVMEERTGSWIALAVTSLLFGLIHLVNPDASLWGAIAIAVEAGLMLGAAYMAARKLWLPIGIHFGWNVAAVAVFGTVSSGNEPPKGFLDAATSGPAVLTGGAFGPEGSLFSILFCSVLTLVFLRVAKRRGNVVPRRRRGEPARAAATQPR